MLLVVDNVLHGTPSYIEKQVNQTILGNCLYFNKRNLHDYPDKKRKNHTEQYNNYLLLQTLSKTAKEELEKKDSSGLQLKVLFYEDSSKKTLIAQEYCAVGKADRAYTVSWNKTAKIVLQKMFPASTSLAICLGKDTDISKNSFLFESIGIEPFIEEGDSGGWIIYPLRRVSDVNCTEEQRMLLTVLNDYSKGLYLNSSKKKESSAKHPNAFSESTSWMDAEEFNGKYRSKQNCIYTLASDPDANGVCSVYVGEAVTSGNRLKVFTIDGKKYIDHTKDEALERKFTRFRIDMLKEEATPFLHDAQDSIIGTLKMIAAECPNGYVLKNKALCNSISTALAEDTLSRK